MKPKKQTTTLYGQLCQQNVFIDNYLMGQIKTKVVWRFTTADFAAVWSTEHREQTTGDLLILRFLSRSTWTRCHMSQDPGLAREECSTRNLDISKQSNSLSKFMKIKLSKFQCRWTKELIEVVRNAFVNITSSGEKRGNTREQIVR